MRVVVQHLSSLTVVLCLSVAQQAELHHQLASVADAQREGVVAGIELIQGLLGLRVVEEGAGPSFGRTQHVAVGESAAEDNHIDLLECLAPADEVGHHHVFHVEAGQIERVGHLALTVGAFLADDGSLGSAVVIVVSPLEAVLGESAREVFRELHLQRLLLVVLETLLGFAVEALLAVQQVAGLIPDVAQVVDVEAVFLVAVLHNQLALVFHGITNLGIADAMVLKIVEEIELQLVAHLNDHTGILGKECFHRIAVGTDVMQVDVHTATGVGEAHLQQCGDESAGRDIVSGHDPTLLDEFLNGIKAVGEVLGILHGRHVVAYLSKALCESRTAQPLLVEREVDMIEAAVLVVHHHGADHFLDVRHLAAGTDDDGTRRDDLLAIGILLAQRQRVFTCRHVDMQVATEVRQCLYALVQTGVLAFLRAAGPHPVGREADAAESFGERSPHDVGQCLGHRQHTACCRRGQTSLRGMSQGSGNAFLATIVECHHTTVAQRELDFTLTLLAGNLTRHRTVDLVGQPVFAGHGLELQHPLEILVEFLG